MMYLLSRLLLLYYVVFVVPSKSVSNDSEFGEVIFVNVIYRHGARTPDKTYVNDPHKNAFSEGLGALTNEGKEQSFKLGQWLRQRYDGLLTDKYSPSLIYVTSSDADRVLMSALCNLAGLYPPKGGQVWNKEINWQPIPVHTIPQSLDKIIAMKASCPAYYDELRKTLNSSEVQQMMNKYQYIIDILNTNTGVTRNDYKYISNIYDTLLVQNQHKLKLPEWSKEIFPDKMEEPTILRYTLPTWNKKLARLLAGPLLQEFINNFKAKLNNLSTRVMHLYAGHDTTIVNLLNTLEVWDKKLLPYAACLMLELRRDSSGAPRVTLQYLPSTEDDPQLLKIPGCDVACLLDKFIEITKPIVPQDWDMECQNTQ